MFVSTNCIGIEGSHCGFELFDFLFPVLLCVFIGKHFVYIVLYQTLYCNYRAFNSEVIIKLKIKTMVQ